MVWTLHEIHGIKLGLFENLAILAQAYGRAGQAQEGLRVLAEATVAAHNSGESYGGSRVIGSKASCYCRLGWL